MPRCPKCHYRLQTCIECGIQDICGCTGKAQCMKCHRYYHISCMDGPKHPGYCQRPGDH